MKTRWAAGMLRAGIAITVCVAVEAWAGRDFSVVWSHAIGDGVESGEIAPDGLTCAVGLTGKGIRIWQTSDAREVRSFPVYTDANGHEKGQEIECLAWSGDGAYLAAGGNSRPVKIIEIASGKEVLSLPTHETDGMRGHPSGRFFAISDKDAILIIQIPEMRLVSRTKAHGSGINSVDFSRDGKWMVTGAADRKILIWSVEAMTIKKVATLQAPGSVKTARITGDGTYILGACGNAESVVLWERSGRKVGEVKTPGYCDHAEFSPDGKVLVTQAKGQNLLVYSVPELVLMETISRGGDGEYMNWRASKLLVLGGRVITMYATDEKGSDVTQRDGIRVVPNQASQTTLDSAPER